jgi:hypothetical protein
METRDEKLEHLERENADLRRKLQEFAEESGRFVQIAVENALFPIHEQNEELRRTVDELRSRLDQREVTMTEFTVVFFSREAIPIGMELDGLADHVADEGVQSAVRFVQVRHLSGQDAEKTMREWGLDSDALSLAP